MNNKLSMSDLVSALAGRYDMDAKSASLFIKTVFDIVEEYIAKDKLVKIKGLGTFKLVSVSDRESVNVNTGERILIAGHSKLSFTPDAALKDAVNRPFSDFETTVLRDTTSTEDMERIPPAESDADCADADSDGNTEDGQAEDEPENADDVPLSEPADDVVADDVAYIPQMQDYAESALGAEDTPIVNDDKSVESEGGSALGAEDTPMANDDQSVEVGEESTLEDAVPDVQDEPAEETEGGDMQDGEVSASEADSDEETHTQAIPTQVASVSGSDMQDSHTYPMAAEGLAVSNGKIRHFHGWMYVLLTLALMALSYLGGHYRVLDRFEVNWYPEEDVPLHENEITPSPAVKPTAEAVSQEVPSPVDSTCHEEDSIQRDTIATEAVAVKPVATLQKEGDATVQEEEATTVKKEGGTAGKTVENKEEDLSKVIKYFPQLPNGTYWIVGDAGRVHYVQPDETLSGIAHKELGDRKLVTYLILFNDFDDPNNIHRGDAVRIPKLVRK